MSDAGVAAPAIFAQVGLVHFLIQAIVSLLVCELMRKKNWIKFGDMKLET